jgi:hypothetical protein
MALVQHRVQRRLSLLKRLLGYKIIPSNSVQTAMDTLYYEDARFESQLELPYSG